MDVSNIYYIESQAHNLIYHTQDGVFVASGTMKQAEKALDGLNFSRGNKGYLINLEHVEKDVNPIASGGCNRNFFKHAPNNVFNFLFQSPLQIWPVLPVPVFQRE